MRGYYGESGANYFIPTLGIIYLVHGKYFGQNNIS